MAARRYLVANCFGVWVALAAVVGSVTFFIDPAVGSDASIHQAVGHLDQIYNAIYFCGGVMTLAGMLALNLRMELSGLCLLGSAFFINGVAIIAIHGGAGVSGGSVVISLGIACIIRVEELWRTSEKVVR